MNRNILIYRIISIVTIAAGYGWAGGHYIPPNSSPITYLFQIIILMILFIMATGYLQLPDKRKWEKHWSIRGLTIFSALSFLINIANIIHGSLNTSSNSFGSHNTMADLVPIAIILTGTGLWLLTIKRSVVTSVLKC